MLIVDNGRKKELQGKGQKHVPKKPLNPHQKEKENPQGIGLSKGFEKLADVCTNDEVRLEFLENVDSTPASVYEDNQIIREVRPESVINKRL